MTDTTLGAIPIVSDELESPARRALRRLFKRKGAVIGLVVIATFIVLALFSPFVSPYDPIVIRHSEGYGFDWRLVAVAGHLVPWSLPYRMTISMRGASCPMRSRRAKKPASCFANRNSPVANDGEH